MIARTLQKSWLAAMDIQALRYFRAVANHKSLTGAAKALGVSQPTLSVAMQNLESRLSTTLLARDRSGVSLTSTGEELYRYTIRIFDLLDEAEERVRGIEQGDVGTFVLGCYWSLGAYFLPAFMTELMKTDPGIELQLLNEQSSTVRDKVISREVHFGIVVNPQPHPDLVMLDLYEDAIDLLVSKDSARPHATLEDARQVYVDGPVIYAGRVSELVDQLANEGLATSRKLVCGDLEQVKSLVLAGLGVGVLPRRVAAYGHEGKLVRLHPTFPIFPDRIQLLFRADMHKTRASTRLKEALVAYGRTLDALR